jgi:hypothetical protein
MIAETTVAFVVVLATIPVAFFAGYHAGVETAIDDVDVDVEEDEP